MVSKPREVIINLDENTVIVKTTIRRNWDGSIDTKENLNVKAAGIDTHKDNAIPAITLGLVIDGKTIYQKLPKKGDIIWLSEENKQGGWPDEEGRDYSGALHSGSLTYRKHKRPRTAMDKEVIDENE